MHEVPRRLHEEPGHDTSQSLRAMRVLITGIDGFVGSHATEFILQAGAGTTAHVELHGTILIHTLRNISHLRDSLTLHHLDVSDSASVETLFRKILPDRVLHIAGQAFVPAAMENPMETFRANLLGGLSILEAARKQLLATGKSPAVLIVSSGEVYGRVDPHNLPITEDAPIRPNNPYASSKASLDIIAQQYAKHFGVNVVIVRPFNHVGPRQSPSFVISDFAKQFAEIASGRRKPAIHVGNVSVRRDFTDVRDVVKAYWLLLERRSDEFIFNVASARAVEIRQLLEILKEVSGLDVKIVQDQERIRSYDIPVVVASYDRLQKATGWTPNIPLHQTLDDVYKYWLSATNAKTSPPAPTPR